MPSSLCTCWHIFEGKDHFVIIGYGRTSTIEQVAGLEGQIRDLKAAGAEKLFQENVSSVAPRKQLEAAIEFAREGDTLLLVAGFSFSGEGRAARGGRVRRNAMLMR
jgi:hypothetical protein